METAASPKTPATPFYALIVAGGSGARLGGDVPKQYQDLGGKTVLCRTVEAFRSCPGLKGLCVVIHPDHEDLFAGAFRGVDLPDTACAGKTRKSSVFNGLKYFSNVKNEDVILIHDAARPFIDRRGIEDVVQSLIRAKASTLAVPVADTLIRDGELAHKDSDNNDSRYVNRNGLWSVQTPQGFHYGVIKTAHERAAKDADYTDDTSLVAAMDIPVTLVPGSRLNFKITTQDDMALAQTLFQSRKSTRTGFGYDVHAFDMGKTAKSVRLCGVDVPHTHGLAGHSDADVGLHAITDALLGAIASGDIGQHFPPSDPKWKGMDSAHFLSHAVNLVQERGGSICNLDVTIVCEAPKVGPHREAMQKRIAEICGINADQVGVKATTSEKLGFTGRGEGIAAQAVATIEIYS